MHEMSRVVSLRKNFFCFLYCAYHAPIMKKKSDEKREKISFERRRLVEELHALARRNFPRRRVIVRRYDDLWQTKIVEMHPYSLFNRSYHYHTYCHLCIEQVYVGHTAQEYKRDGWSYRWDNLKEQEMSKKIYRSMWEKNFTTLTYNGSWKNRTSIIIITYSVMKTSVVEQQSHIKKW